MGTIDNDRQFTVCDFSITCAPYVRVELRVLHKVDYIKTEVKIVTIRLGNITAENLWGLELWGRVAVLK